MADVCYWTRYSADGVDEICVIEFTFEINGFQSEVVIRKRRGYDESDRLPSLVLFLHPKRMIIYYFLNVQ